MRIKTKFAFISLILLLIPIASAAGNIGHINLLAVSTIGENETGSVADLYLEIKPGTGRVFLDTYPLTKIDTQFSTRLANSLACDYTNIDCDKLDFFYTIKSRSTIVGGPSAGAATTILTIIMLKGEKIPDDFAVTGTINSGGLIGPIAGVKSKVKAAEEKGLNKVLIPTINVGNTTEIENFLNSSKITVVKISNIDDALYNLTGKRKWKNSSLEVSTVFTEVMGKIAESLCDATKKIMVNWTNTTFENRGKALYEKSLNASKDRAYYSQASFCFGANVQFRNLDLKNKTNPELKNVLNKIRREIINLEDSIDSMEISTIDDLQTYIIVKERINDAKEYIVKIDIGKNYTNLSSENIAYSIERYNSAVAWSKFFGTGKKGKTLSKESQRTACIGKISEVQGYKQYISTYIDTPLVNIDKDIDDAANYLEKGDYALCISKASRAKAESSMILEALSISNDEMKTLLSQKIEIAKQSIISEQEKGIFPILGYSYYEYAKSLSESDPNSALLYTAYSIELSNLDVYFEQKKDDIVMKKDYTTTYIFMLGIVLGIILTSSVVIIKNKMSNSKKHKNFRKPNNKKR